jgi:hypothetical protein
MAEIRSTLEKVLERAAAMGSADREALEAEEQVKNGMRMAADYLRGNAVDFSGILEGEEAAPVRQGAVQAFLRNITLPRDDDKQTVEKAMRGLLELARGSGDLASVFQEMHGILDNYQKHKMEIRQQVEEAFRQQMQQTLAQQGGAAGMDIKIDPMMHPKFQEEWSRVKGDLDNQYNQVLQQHKSLVAGKLSVSLL